MLQRSLLTILTVVSLLALISCATPKKEYESAKAVNTIEGYEQYLKEYPNNKYSKFAKKKIAELQDDEAFRKAKRQNSIRAFKNYIHESGPDSRYVHLAKNSIIYLEESRFNEAKEKDTIESYRNYLELNTKNELHNKYAINRIEEIEKETILKWMRKQESFSIFYDIFVKCEAGLKNSGPYYCTSEETDPIRRNFTAEMAICFDTLFRKGIGIKLNHLNITAPKYFWKQLDRSVSPMDDMWIPIEFTDASYANSEGTIVISAMVKPSCMRYNDGNYYCRNASLTGSIQVIGPQKISIFIPFTYIYKVKAGIHGIYSYGGREVKKIDPDSGLNAIYEDDSFFQELSQLFLDVYGYKNLNKNNIAIWYICQNRPEKNNANCSW